MPTASFHLLPGTGADWLAWAATGAPAIKVCDAALVAPAKTLGAAPLYRPCFLPSDNGEGACADGDAWGRAVLSELARYGTPWPAVVQFRNELPCTADAAAQYARFRAVLRQAGFPGLVGFGSFGVGQPDWPQYQYLAGADCVIFDEYLDLTVAGSAPYYALRHVEAIRRGLLSPTQPLYIGEWGSDALGIEDRQKRRGWQDRGKLTAAQQAANLRAYLAGCAPSVQRVFVFCDGPTPPAPAGWSDFATRSTAVETAIRATWQQKGTPVLAGIDVSSSQTSLDWPAIAASGVAFSAIKVSEGVGWPSPAFAAQWAGAGAAGLTRIAYHFCRCDLAGNSPDAEAAYFLGLAGPVLRPGDLVALDIELGSGDLSGWALQWLAHVAAVVGCKPLLYTYPSFQRATLTAPALAAYPLWYASYQDQAPSAPAPWQTYAIWQHTDAASVPGVAGLVDGDVTWLSAADLRGLGKPAADPPKPSGQEYQDVVTITPAIQAAARARLSALGQHVVPGGAIEKELVARYALGQANPQLGTLTPTPVVGGEVALPDGRAYCLLDSGELLEYRAGAVDNPEEVTRASIVAACWPGRFS